VTSGKTLRIALAYRKSGPSYDNYEFAANRAADALGAAADVFWIAGPGSSPDAPVPAFDALVLTGGDDVDPIRYGAEDSMGVCEIDRDRDAIEWPILDAALERRVPILAICRGAQLLNVHRGGTLIVDLGAKNVTHKADGADRRHAIEMMPGTLLSEPAGALEEIVNSSHHQAVDRLAPPFRPSAFSSDGVLEAFEWAGPQESWLLAVQWHPERLGDAAVPLGEELFRRLITAAAERKR
jgi:putative glutamine amidotransferase